MHKPTRTPGRPRVYESTSEKISAFRQRQEQAGFVRKEVLVTHDTVERVRFLAEQHGVKPTDVYSALLEYGLNVYEPRATPRGPSSSVEETAPNSSGGNPFSMARLAALSRTDVHANHASSLPDRNRATKVPASTTLSETLDDPITRFFAKRKERQHEKK
jgi:hypothetical protein